jgi:hypothetical protein
MPCSGVPIQRRWRRPGSVVLLGWLGVGLALGCPTGRAAESQIQGPVGDPLRPTGVVFISPAPWRPAPLQASPNPWQPVANQLDTPTEYQPAAPVQQKGVFDKVEENPGIFGIGGGVGWGGQTGENTSGVLTGRLGYKLSEAFALSLRPSYIWGNRDMNGDYNNEGSFQLPLTVDLFPDFVVSPYLGVGLATNTDSTGATDGMITGGLDINVLEHLTIGLNLNYVIQSAVNDTDWEAMTLIYLKF